MTKGEKLIWDLFLMVREVMPATAENTRRQHEWAAAFHGMEHPETPPTAPVQDAEPAEADADDDDESPTTPAGRRKR